MSKPQRQSTTFTLAAHDVPVPPPPPAEDPLRGSSADHVVALVEANPSRYSPGMHLKTYTAGEDKSRLQAAAKELGLEQARWPRKQVRKKRSLEASRKATFFLRSLLDSATEDARIRSVYSSHRDLDHDFFVSQEWERPVAEGLLEEVVEEELMNDGHCVPAGANLTAAVLGIIKGMVGPAILYLPHGFAKAGYVPALAIMLLCTALFLHSSTCLLDSWKLQQPPQSQFLSPTLPAGEDTPLIEVPDSAKPMKRPLPLSYPELAYRAFGARGESMVKTGIALMQSGVCLTYLIFVPQNLRTVSLILIKVAIPVHVWLLVMVIIQVPLSWLRDIRRLTPTNLLANALILYGLLVCLGFAVQAVTTPLVPGQTTENTNAWDAIGQHFEALQPFCNDWYLFIGASVLLFEGSITLLVPLQEAVYTDEHRAQFPAVNKRVILGIICFYAFFGTTNWIAFGNSVRTVLTTSLPTNALATTVQLAYSIAVIFTFPLQNFPALEIACRTISNALMKQQSTSLASLSTTTSSLSWWTRRNVISSCLVCLLAVIAVCAMESLDKVVSLMGSLLGCPITFVFPPLIHSRLDSNLSTTRLWGNRIVAGLGVIAMVLASTTTILTWNSK